MQPIRVFQSGTWYPFLEEKAWQGKEKALWILPDKKNHLYLQRAHQELAAVNISTIPDMMAQYIKTKKKEKLLGIHGVESILGAILSSAQVPFLKMERYRQGYVKALTDFFYHFRSTSLFDLHTALEGFRGDRLSPKERDLMGIYQEYEKKLPQYGYDLQRAYWALKEDVEEEPLSQLFDFPPETPIIFFGFHWVTPLEEAFILLTAAHAHRVLLPICQDSRAAEQSLRIQNSITALLRQLNQPPEQEISGGEGSFSSLANALFHSQKVSWRGSFQDRLFIRREDNRTHEVISVARQIKALTYQGVPLTDIRVVAPDYSLYSSIIQEVFPTYQIPFSLEEGVPLLRYPLALVLFQLVNQSIQPNPYPLREKIFLSPYVDFSSQIERQELLAFQEEEGVELVDQEQLSSYLKGDDRYSLDYHFIRDLSDRAYQALRPDSGTPPLEVAAEYLHSLEGEREEKTQEQVQCLIQFFLLSQAGRRLSPWRSKMEGRDFKEAFLLLCKGFGIQKNIQALPDEEPFSTIKKRDMEVWKRILLLLEELESICTGTHNIMELIRVFGRLLDEGYLQEEGTGPRVQVQPITAGHYKKWDYTFLVGLVDGEFPEEESFNFLQPRKEGLSLGHSYTQVDHARNTFYHLIRSTDTGLYLSQPLSHNGKMLPSSPFLHEVEKFYPDTAASPPGGEALYSQREELCFIGEQVDHQYSRVQPLLKRIRDRDSGFGSHILEILRFDGLVADPTRLSPYEGLFSPQPYLLKHLEEEIEKITFTPRVFERYASCPMRFFLDDLLQLKERPDFHPDTSETGLFIRSLLEEYTEKAAQVGGVPLGIEKVFMEWVEEYFEKTYGGEEDAFAARMKTQLLGGLGGDEREGRPGLFQAFLDYEQGAPDRLQISQAGFTGPVVIGPDLRIEARIDRVDKTLDQRYLLVYVYTTGYPPHPKKVLQGISFELPLAIFLGEEHCKGNPSSLAGGGYYMVRGPRAIKRRDYLAIKSIQASRLNQVSDLNPVFSGQWQGFMKDTEFSQVLEAIKKHLQRLHELMKQGVFHLSLGGRNEGICLHCSFSRICRKDELLQERLCFHLMHNEQIQVIKEII